MILYGILLALARYPFHVMRPRSYGRAWRTRPRTAWAMTCIVTYVVALAASWSWSTRDPVFYYAVLPWPTLWVAVMVAITTTGWPRWRRAVWWALAGYLIGFVLRDAFPPPNFAFDFVLPAVYAATGAVLACWTG